MIKVNELRIGNYIYNAGDIIAKITGFKPFEWSIRCDEEEGCDLLVDLYQPDKKRTGFEIISTVSYPIPLTPEWLERCGFKDGKLNGVTVGYDGDDFIHAQLSVPYDGQMLKVKYLHQLQNLYFAMTGEELRIDL